MTSRNCTLLWALLAVGLAAASPAAAPAASPAAAPAAPPAAAAPRLAALTASSASKGSAQFRLPQTAIPVDYTIVLTVNIPSSNTFTGTVTIKVIAVRNVPFLVLHVNPKVIKKMSTVTVKGGSGADKISESDAIQQQTDEQFETLKLTLPRRLAIGAEYTLTIEYEGTLREDMYGFYRSTYKKNGVDTILAATQFEPTHARSAFPCWDEPQYKATFDISITHDSKLQALSNTPGTPTTAAAATTTTTKFAKTPLMSSYLVAFVVSDFASQASTVNPSQPSSATTSIPYKVWVRPDQVDQAAYAASVGPKILEQMQMYTKIDFQSFGIGKLDLVAIPDFSAGAMENWGLITYRETALMYKNKDESTESSKESIALVVAHEQAHMWFGDLVSPEWWDYTWLNEGFARYFQYVSTDLVNPQWRLMDSFVVQTLHSALQLDALASSHPLSAVVFSPDDIQGVFDSISYDKGASVLHMTRKVMGDENFKTALQNYLEEMKFSAARPADLFGALTSANIAAKNPANLPEGVTIGTVLVTWTREAGYPLVTIQSQGKEALVSQTRFLSSPTESSEAGPSWWVPLTYKVQGGTGAQRMWLEPNKNSSITGLEQGKWILANINQEGFYRVNYDESNWAALATYLRSVSPASMTDISVLNRAQLLDDALSLARSGALRYPLALDVTRYLHNETDPIPWRAALSQFSFLSKMLANTEAQDTFKTYVLSLLDAVYKAVGFAETETTDEATMDQNHLKLTFRSSLLSQACSLGHADCVKEATAAFQAFISGTQVKPSQRSAVYCTGLRQGSKTDWDNLWKRYENADTTAGEKIIILSALGCTSDQTTLKDYLTKSLDSKAVRAQDASTVFTAVLAGSEANLDIAFTFFKTNFEAMNKAYGGWSSMQKVVEGLATRMPDKQKLQELENFLATNSEKLGVAQAASVRALETARANMVWREKNIQSVSSWLRGESGTNGSSSSTASLLSAALAALTALLYCRS